MERILTCESAVFDGGGMRESPQVLYSVAET